MAQHKKPPGTATLITRGIIIVAALGTLAIILLGLLQPGTPTGPSSQGTAQAGVGSEVGNAAPNFTLAALSGKRVSLSDYRGRPVVLNFWYATCPGCLTEIPGMQRFYAARHAAGKDLAILGVNVLDDAPTAKAFVREYGLTYQVVLDQGQRVEALYNVNATPTSYFIDRRGVIRARVIGPVDDAALNKHVGQIS